jgi:hypothetical protein
MSWSLERLRPPAACEALIRDTNAFIAHAYDRENALARRSYVYEFSPMETFAFALHCPGDRATDHLPGFALDALPPSLAMLTREVTDRLSIKRGRVLWNVGRYFEDCGPITPHHDGELFDYEIVPRISMTIRSGIRPREVAILTLRDETPDGGTRLHDETGAVLAPPMGPGDLLRFDNTLFMHSVPNPFRATDCALAATNSDGRPRWVRYTMGWRALDDGCFDWGDGRLQTPLDVDAAVALHERFLREEWPRQREIDVARATFPFPEVYA